MGEYIRDVQVALDVRKMAELGYFETEFTMYGTSFFLDGEVNYRVSSNADHIYHYIETSALNHIYCMNPVKHTKKYYVASGTKEDKELREKYLLAKQIQSESTKEFFSELDNIAKMARDNCAYKLLKEEQGRLVGSFDEYALQLYENMVQYCYANLMLDMAGYNDLMHWLRQEKANTGEEPKKKDVFTKILYGMAYKENGKYHYIENGLRENLYKKKYELNMNHIATTPIITYECNYNYEYSLVNAKRDFLKDLEYLMNKDFLQMFEKITMRLPKKIGVNLAQMKNEYGENASQTLQKYLFLWNVE